MQIFIKQFGQNTISLNIEPNATIEFVKQKIQEKVGIPTKQQRLIFEGIPLLEGTLRTYNIKLDSTIDLVMCLG